MLILCVVLSLVGSIDKDIENPSSLYRLITYTYIIIIWIHLLSIEQLCVLGVGAVDKDAGIT